MQVNKTLHWLDVRETDITRQQHNEIKQYLLRNRLGLNHIDELPDFQSEHSVEALPVVDETEVALPTASIHTGDAEAKEE